MVIKVCVRKHNDETREVEIADCDEIVGEKLMGVFDLDNTKVKTHFDGTCSNA